MNMLLKTKRLYAAVIILMTAAFAYADEISFTAQAPKTVVAGNRFQITYTVNTRDVKDFRAPDMDGLSVLAGPSTSTSSSTQINNGSVTQSTTVKFTYTVVAREEGTVSIPAASIVAEKNRYESNSLTISVLPPDSSQPQTQQRSGGQTRQQPAGQGVNTSDLFMLATVDKTTVYEQEALLLSFKIYVSPSLNLTNLSSKMPDLKNFHVQEVELPQQKEFQLEHYNGRNYKTLLWQQYVLFPQHSGELEIPSITYEGIISQPVESNDVFDMFFNAGRYVETRHDLVTRKIAINVKPLPSGKTGSFYGGVGDFSISSTINSTDINANDAVTVRVVLSGTGNLKLVKTPELKLPQDFDIYDPKVENKYTIKGGRQTGNKVFEYLAIPRHGGEYTIPALEFQFFDPKAGEYRTIKTDEYQLHVAKGQGGSEQTQVAYVSKEELKYVGQDVRFHATPLKLESTEEIFFGSALFYLLLTVPVIILIVLVILSRKRIADNANQGRTRVRKASSVATKRLKTARKLMNDGDKNRFYDEMMRALTGYLGDKLSIPVADLSKDNIESALKNRNVSDDLVSAITRLLDDCEFARFAPGDETGRMDHLYEEAVSTIGRIENIIK